MDWGMSPTTNLGGIRWAFFTPWAATGFGALGNTLGALDNTIEATIINPATLNDDATRFFFDISLLLTRHQDSISVSL
jgi:hypothetical protein